MDVEALQSFIIDKLNNELPGWLAYHNTGHTEQVIKHALELGRNEGLNDEELVLLHTAALMHDTGFTSVYVNHEEASCELSRKILPGYNYSTDQIEAICKMIMATKLPQSPGDKLSYILCDADLYYIGTNDYLLYADRLFCELKHNNENITNEDWLKIQNDFLTTHSYFTATAKNNLELNKQKNIKKFVQLK